MKWTEAVRDMAEGKIRVCQDLKHRIEDWVVQYYHNGNKIWYNAIISVGMQVDDWTIPEPTYREISWKEAVDVDWKKLEYWNDYFNEWKPRNNTLDYECMTFIRQKNWRVKVED